MAQIYGNIFNQQCPYLRQNQFSIYLNLMGHIGVCLEIGHFQLNWKIEFEIHFLQVGPLIGIIFN